MSAPQDRVAAIVATIDKELSKYPAIVNIEKATGVPKAYGAIGAVSLYLFLILFNLGGQLLTNLAGFVVPTYYSLDALFSASTEDDRQWLTYWVVFSSFTVMESFIQVVYWFPFYFLFKFVFLLWLSLPITRGAELIFNSFMAPMLSRYFRHGSTASNLRSKAEGLAKSD
ncbi:hypothetical protein TD95_000195 [Thielaviopsis punctulata]|uniref:Protein YOP1 n=1 Tax=Thielaviopsis punctulata TaxID=72032 RepID=A0A0F4ZE19_9PEZI|nr:hypothetical protein TD95_000195 [Thielaviopsis punctulata]